MNCFLMIIAWIFLFGFATGAQDAASPQVVFDFETGDLDGWVVMEGSFGKVVCDRAEYHHSGGAYRKHGTYFLSTLESPKDTPDDRYTGVIVSPVVKLAGPVIELMVGGGSHDSTYVALCTLDGREHAKGQGKNSQQMQDVRWEIPDLVGQSVFLRVVDHHERGWGHLTLDYVRIPGTLDSPATKQMRVEEQERRETAELKRRLNEVNLGGVRAAIKDLLKRFPYAYDGGPERLARLEALTGEVKALLETEKVSKADLDRVLERCEQLRNESLKANPLLTQSRILYVQRQQYRSDHHNTATLFQKGEINGSKFQGPGALKTFDLRTGEVSTLVDCADGLVRDPDVSFDGRRILFSMRRKADDDTHIYEINADGTGLRQLTGAPGVSDIDPLYLPDGDIVFSSTREPKYCMCNRHIMCNLFRMEADGANIRQIGKSTLFEGHGSLLPDGRIIYDRWEYVDRNFGDAQGLWTVNPDGTNHAVYWGNNTASPGAVLDARIIPGKQQVVVTLSSCHDRPWGAIGIIDRSLGIDGKSPIVRTWPASAMELVGQGNYDKFKRVRPRYEDPYPLDGTYFLCARTFGDGERTAIFCIDTFGNEVLLHEDENGCYDPMPVASRPVPPVIPDRRDYTNRTGRLYVLDAERGTHMAGVAPGTAKFLRVVESPEKRYWTNTSWGGQGVHCPAMNWHSFENKRILGTVPIEKDGSACFELPADRFVFFQLLDENGMMIQSMRSGTMVQSGETTGCVGCHEHRLEAPPPATSSMPQALRRAPDQLHGWHGPARILSFQQEVQPVFDRHCVSCHDFGKPAGKKLLLCGDREITFSASYVDLWRTRTIKCVGGGPAEVQPAKSWGSHASKLVAVIRNGHKGVKLSPEEFDRIVTWVDLNAPYYPTYASAYPVNLTGRCPLTPEELKKLGELVNVDFRKLASHSRKQRANVSFTRPELSPCLATLKDKPEQLAEALRIITVGKERLSGIPRGDMPGFQPCPVDARRTERYETRAAEELRSRAALADDKKAYDEGLNQAAR